MNFGVVIFPGTWSDCDFHYVISEVLHQPVRYVWHRDANLAEFDCLILPGGFSYGDYLRCGAMAAHSPAMREVAERAKKGVAVLGVCNGFQVLAEAGLLPGALLRNASLKFVCRSVTLKVENSQTLFTSGYEKGQTLSVPVAHGEGNYFAEEATLDRLEERGQIAFRYVGNPNGSARDIAGIFNETKNVLGMMPHPENAIDPLQGSTDGAPLFSGLVQALS
jgi:phosphoribosylformylglycinamidine synthase subunit PurQ / glutaminase